MTRTVLSLGNFFSVAHFFLIVYALGPYLTTFMKADSVGLVISLGAVGSLGAFGIMPRLIDRYGARRLAIGFALLEAVALLVLAFNPIAVVAVLMVALACATSPLIAYQLDLLLEATVQEESKTGRIRTAFLTSGNAALIIAPIIAGLVLDGTEHYNNIFLIAAISLLPFIFLFIARRVPEGKKPEIQSLRETLEIAFQDTDMRAVIIAEYLLQAFYQLSQLYVPLYLHVVLGISWVDLGWMLAIALLPFVLLEYPAGALADVLFGDRRLMIAGFVTMGISFGLVALIGKATPFSIVLIVLLLSRAGAALVEAMAEGHFFRRVSEKDAETVGIFRMTRPVSALTAPVLGSALLALFGYYWLFLITGALLLFAGILAAFHIRDIRPRVSAAGGTAPPPAQSVLPS